MYCLKKYAILFFSIAIMLTACDESRQQAAPAPLQTSTPIVIPVSASASAPVVISVSSSASAPMSPTSESSSQQWPSEKDLCWENDGCICEKDLPKFPVQSPQNMSLVSVCNYSSRPSDNFLVGTFYFGGDVTIKGKLSSERQGGEEGAGDYLYFYGDHPSEAVLFSDVMLRLSFGASLPNNAEYPDLSDENNCWSADAVLNITSLKVVWSEQDDAGDFPLEYKVVKIGKFDKCKLPY